MQGFERLLGAQKNSQMALNEFASGIRATISAVDTLAASMRGVAEATRAAAAAAAKMKFAPGSAGSGFTGGAAPGAGASPPPSSAGGALVPMNAGRASPYVLIPSGGGGGARVPIPIPPEWGDDLTGGVPRLRYNGGGGGGGGGRPDEPFFAPGEGPPIPLPLGGSGGRGDWTGTFFKLAIPTYLGWSALKEVWEATAEPAAIKANLQAQGFSPEQVAAATKAAQETQQKTFGSSYVGNLDIISKLMAVTQSPENAISAMPELAKLGVVLGAFGQGDQGGALMDAIRAGEFRGILSSKDPKTGEDVIDIAKLAPFIHNVMITDVMSHGQIGPKEILQFLRSGGSGARMVSDDFLFADAMALQMAMRSANAGTGLQGLQMQFSGGKMSSGAVGLLRELGILHETGDESDFRKTGMGQFILGPGAFTDPDAQTMARENPADFVEKYLKPRFDAWIKKQPAFAKELSRFAPDSPEYNRTLTELETAETQATTSRVPGGKLESEVLGNFALIERDRKARLKLMGFDPETGKRVGPEQDFYGIEVANNPIVQTQALDAAWKAFLASMGDAALKPAIGMLNDLTSVLNQIANWARNNPDGAKLAMEGFAAGLALFAVGTAAAGGMMVLGGLVNLARAFALFAPAAEAGAGLTLLASPAMGLIALAAGVKAVCDALKEWFPQTDKQKEGMKSPTILFPPWDWRFWHPQGITPENTPGTPRNDNPIHPQSYLIVPGGGSPVFLAAWHGDSKLVLPPMRGDINPPRDGALTLPGDTYSLENILDYLNKRTTYRNMYTRTSESYALPSQDAPVRVIVVNEQGLPVRVINPGDIARGAATWLGTQMSRPPTGTTGVDLRVSPMQPGLMAA